MKKNKKFKNNNLLFAVFFFVFLISFIFLFSFIGDFYKRRVKYNADNILDNKNYDIVYDRTDISVDTSDHVPMINISCDVCNNINSEIYDMYTTKDEYSTFDYKYNLSKDTLSLLIIKYMSIDNNIIYDFTSYIVDLNNFSLLDDTAVLKKFDITQEQFDFFINNKFLNYYADLLDKNYIEGRECNFDCFLSDKCNLSSFYDYNSFYIEDNHLYLYKYFNTLEYSEYFKDEDFVFEVK